MADQISLTLKIVSLAKDPAELAKLANAVVHGACARAGVQLAQSEYGDPEGMRLILKVTITGGLSSIGLPQMKPLLEYGFGDALAKFPSASLIDWEFVGQDSHEHFPADMVWKSIEPTDHKTLLKVVEIWLTLVPLKDVGHQDE